MQGVLTSLMADLVEHPAITSTFPESEEFWFRAIGRFDTCARWIDEERCVQLSSFLRRPGDVDLDGEGWHASTSQQGDGVHALLWHPTSSTVAALSRASAQALDAASFPAFVQGFINRLAMLDRIFKGAGGNDDI